MINPISTSISGMMVAAKKVAVSADNIVNATSDNVENNGIKLNNAKPFTPDFSANSSLFGGMDTEIINMKVAENAYKANISAMRTGMEMHNTLMDAIDDKP